MKNYAQNKAALMMAIMLGSLGFTGAVSAAVSVSPLNLSWQGVIANPPSTGGTWKFVDAVDTGVDFVPSVSGMSIVDGTAGAKNITLDPVRFALAPTGSGKFKGSTSIKAYLAYAPDVVGLSGTPSSPTVNMKINGTALPTGAGSAMTVQAISADSADAVPVSVTGNTTLASGTFNAGNSVRIDATIMFSADIA